MTVEGSGVIWAGDERSTAPPSDCTRSWNVEIDRPFVGKGEIKNFPTCADTPVKNAFPFVKSKSWIPATHAGVHPANVKPFTSPAEVITTSPLVPASVIVEVAEPPPVPVPLGLFAKTTAKVCIANVPRWTWICCPLRKWTLPQKELQWSVEHA